MKKIFILCAVTLVALGVVAWRVAAKPSRFGRFAGVPQVAVAQLIAEPKQFTGKLVAAEGTITQQCKSMGCYFFFRSGDQTLRVDLQEVAMTAPMHEGKRARVEGQLVSFNGGFQLYASAVEFL